jgi:hypothetical protein
MPQKMLIPPSARIGVYHLISKMVLPTPAPQKNQLSRTALEVKESIALIPFQRSLVVFLEIVAVNFDVRSIFTASNYSHSSIGAPKTFTAYPIDYHPGN